MIALTARLNERDDQIIQLQTEQDALERINKDQCSDIDLLRARVHDLESALKENGCKVPDERARKLTAGIDGGRKYLPHATSSVTDELLDAQYDGGEFMTADQKVDELTMILHERESELRELREDCADKVVGELRA